MPEPHQQQSAGSSTFGSLAGHQSPAELIGVCARAAVRSSQQQAPCKAAAGTLNAFTCWLALLLGSGLLCCSAGREDQQVG